MLPTVPFSLLCGLLLGLLFAWAARNQFRDGRLPWGRELRAVVSYQVLIRWPLVTYFFVLHREWSFLDTVSASRLPLSLLLVILPLDAAALLIGYVGGWALLKRRGAGALQLANLGAAVALGTFVVVLRNRLLHEGDAVALARGTAPLITRGRLLWVLLVVTAGACAAAFEVYRTLVSESRRSPGELRRR